MNSVQEKSERRSRLSPAATRRQALHARLLKAADRAIAEGGLASLRARALADEVGCSVGAIYGVFRDLDALILAVNGRTLDAIDAVMARAGAGRGPADRLTDLAEAYLDYAASNRQRWQALFQHRVLGGALPKDYAARRATVFSHIEQPLAALRPDIPGDERALLARTLFSAVHGMVELGLDEKLATMPLPLLRAQIRLVVTAMAKGL